MAGPWLVDGLEASGPMQVLDTAEASVQGGVREDRWTDVHGVVQGQMLAPNRLAAWAVEFDGQKKD